MPVFPEPRNNLTATSAPTASNDITEGYAVGSVWVDTTSGLRYTCQDETEDAAIWITSSTGSAVLSTSWRFSSTITSGDPGSRNFRLNNATQSSATEIYISDIAESGVDVSTILSNLESGDQLYIQEASDSTRYHLFTLNAAGTDNTGWWTLTGSVTDSGLDLANNRACAFVLLFGAGGGGGGGSSYETWRFVINGKPNVQTNIDGAWIAPRAGTVTRVTLFRRTAGSSGSTIVDVNKNGTTIYTTQSNRPTVTQAGGDNQIDATTDFDVSAFAQNDRFQVDIDTVESGNPQDISVIIEVQYT